MKTLALLLKHILVRFTVLLLTALALGLATPNEELEASQDTVQVNVPASAAVPPTRATNPGHGWIDFSRFAPRQILVGPQIGVMGSRMVASSGYAALVMPGTQSVDPWIATSFGVMATARWNHGISVTVAPRQETIGAKTKQQTVGFPQNPFPHTLQAETELTYNVWPLLVGMGWYTHRQHFQVQVGTFAALYERGRVRWTVDGADYANVPTVQIQPSQTGWLLGTEYGIRMGSGELLLGVESQRQNHSLMSGLPGTLQAESARAHLAFMWTVLNH